MNSAIRSMSGVIITSLVIQFGAVTASTQASVDSDNSYPNVGALMIWRVDDSGKPTLIGSLGDAEAMKAFIKNDDWNDLHLIIRGNQLTHILNGHVMSIVVDDDAAHRRFDGLIGVQVHVGGPMKIEYRDFRLKPL